MKKLNKIIRYYNQNRNIIWIGIIFIIFVIVIIQLLNSFYSSEEKSTDSTQEIIAEEKKNIEEKNESMVQGAIGSYEKKEEYTKLIEEFLEYCCNGQPENAYKLLSNDCKEKLYPTEKSFETEYYGQKFKQSKTYDFQLWSAVDKTYIYLVKLYDNMLSTGIVSDSKYIQDYYSVIQDNNVYKLSINGYIKNINYQQEDKNAGDDGNIDEGFGNDGIKIVAQKKECYMDYEIYNILVINKTNQDILLDSLKNSKNIAVVDENGSEFNAMTIELNEEDLIVPQQSSKFLDIKFARSYVSNLETKAIKFKKIIKNYEEYKQNIDSYTDCIEMNVDLK